MSSHLCPNGMDLIRRHCGSIVAPLLIAANIGKDVGDLFIIEDTRPGNHRTARVEWFTVYDQARSLDTLEHNSNDPARIFFIHQIGTRERRKLTRLAQPVWLMALRTSRAIINFETVVKRIGAAAYLKCLHLLCARVRRVYLGFEPAAVFIEIDRAPVQQQKQDDDQPHRHSRALRLRVFSGSVGSRLVGGGTHFAGALVAGAFVAAGLAGGGVRGASYSGVSARRLNKYATSAFASGLGTISYPSAGANS